MNSGANPLGRIHIWTVGRVGLMQRFAKPPDAFYRVPYVRIVYRPPYSRIAQQVARGAVNADVSGSNPDSGAIILGIL